MIKDMPPNPDFPVSDEIKEFVLHAEMMYAWVKDKFGIGWQLMAE